MVDVGISNVAWKRYGTRRRHGVDFGRRWLVELSFMGGGGAGGGGGKGMNLGGLDAG